MQFKWFSGKRRKRVRRVRKLSRAATLHYETHKEHARSVVHERLTHWNQFYGFTYGRVSIKNQRSCWGSCSAKGNLNFNYKIIFLPEVLMDYIIVHELCHLAELNHGASFWSQVAHVIPNFTLHKSSLRLIRIVPENGFETSVHQLMHGN